MRKIFTILFLFITLSVSSQSTYYLSPSGSNANAGTIGSPWATTVYAVTQMSGGDSLILLEGTYYPTAKTTIGVSLNGTPSSRTYIGGRLGHPVVLDYTNYDVIQNAPVPPHIVGNSYGSAFIIWLADCITMENLEIKNIMQVDSFCDITTLQSYRGSNLTFRNIQIHDCEGRGFFHETPWGFGDDPESGYDTTRWINCDAYNLNDRLPYTFGARVGNWSDGFKEYGDGISVMYWEGCRAWNVTDDGWDTGTAQKLYWNNCWSFINGWSSTGDGNAFKLAGSWDSTFHADAGNVRFATNLIAAYNKLTHYFFLEYEDYWRSKGTMYNCASLSSNVSGGNFSNNALPGRENIEWIVRNCAFYGTNWNPSNIYGGAPISAAYKNYTESHNSWEDIIGFPGWKWSDTVSLIASEDWIVYDSASVINQLKASRKANGDLPDITAFRLQGGSDLIGAGTYVGMSATPDIGIDWAYLDAQSEIDSALTDILTLTIPEQTGVSVINTTTHTVTASVVFGTSLTALTPTITLDYGATVSPASGAATNFTSPVVYTVTALDATTEQEWTITVTVAGEGIVAPTVTTTAVIAHSIQAVTGGNATSAGGGTVSAKGICYGTSINPTVTGTHTHNGTGTGAFSHRLDNLTPSTTYHVRAYATNEAGTNYGLNYQFTTSAFSSGRSGGKTLKYNGKTVIIK